MHNNGLFHLKNFIVDHTRTLNFVYMSAQEHWQSVTPYCLKDTIPPMRMYYVINTTHMYITYKHDRH